VGKLRVASFELRVFSCGLQAASYKLQVVRAGKWARTIIVALLEALGLKLAAQRYEIQQVLKQMSGSQLEAHSYF
jgi:hypothetical protein